jgi:hypothetical protein
MQIKKVTTKIIFFGIILLCTSYPVYLVFIEPAQRLELYWLNMIEPSDAKITILSSRMLFMSRNGTCRFTVSSEDFQKIIKSLSLEPITPLGARDDGCIRFSEFSTLEHQKFSRVNRYGFRELSHSSPVPKPGIKYFREKKELPPNLKGNYSSHFNGLLYNPEHQVGCADMQYPYG